MATSAIDVIAEEAAGLGVELTGRDALLLLLGYVMGRSADVYLRDEEKLRRLARERLQGLAGHAGVPSTPPAYPAAPQAERT